MLITSLNAQKPAFNNQKTQNPGFKARIDILKEGSERIGKNEAVSTPVKELVEFFGQFGVKKFLQHMPKTDRLRITLKENGDVRIINYYVSSTSSTPSIISKNDKPGLIKEELTIINKFNEDSANRYGLSLDRKLSLKEKINAFLVERDLKKLKNSTQTIA